MPFLASTNAVRLQSTKARCVYPTTASFLQRFDIFFVDHWPIGIAGKMRFAAEHQPRSVLRFALSCQPRDDPSAFADKDRLAALMHLVNQCKTLCLKLGCVYLHLTSLRDQAYFAIIRKPHFRSQFLPDIDLPFKPGNVRLSEIRRPSLQPFPQLACAAN